MEPGLISHAEWTQLIHRLWFLWLFLAAMSAFGLNFLLAHAIIPSLTYTNVLSPRVARARVLFYGAAALFFVVAIVLLVYAFSGIAGAIRNIYPRWWM